MFCLSAPFSWGVTGVKCAHAPHFQPNCHFPQNFAFCGNKAASDFRTQGERESDLEPLPGSNTGKTHTDSNCWHLEENERILEAKKTTFFSW